MFAGYNKLYVWYFFFFGVWVETMSTLQILSFSGVPVNVTFNPSGSNVVPYVVTNDANLPLNFSTSDATVAIASSSFQPPALTSNTDRGYIVTSLSPGSASSSGNQWRVFDQNIGTPWIAEINSTYSNTGTYTGSGVTIDVSGNIYSGSWIQLQSPIPVSITSTSITTGNGTMYVPREVSILGSSDGLSWKRFASTNYSSSDVVSSPQSISTVSGFSCSYIRVIVTRITGGGKSSDVSLTIYDITFTGSTGPYLNILKPGVITLYASNDGNATYASVSGSVVVTVNKAQQVLSATLSSNFFSRTNG